MSLNLNDAEARKLRAGLSILLNMFSVNAPEEEQGVQETVSAAEKVITDHDARDFRTRVLAHKLAKLNAYIVSPSFFDQVTDQSERSCLSAQASVMQSYVNVLDARIALWRQRGDIA